MTQISTIELKPTKVTNHYKCNRCGKRTENYIENWPIPEWVKEKHPNLDWGNPGLECQIHITAGVYSYESGEAAHYDFHLCGECAGDLLNWIKETGTDFNIEPILTDW